MEGPSVTAILFFFMQHLETQHQMDPDKMVMNIAAANEIAM